MKTKTILKDIANNGGFCNLNNWNKAEVAGWVKSNYNCSTFVAKKVAFYL